MQQLQGIAGSLTQTLPATVVISCRSSSGAKIAAAMATASSMPGQYRGR
ncbi:hypothetical protein ACLK1U_00155 [Escherichia coli]